MHAERLRREQEDVRWIERQHGRAGRGIRHQVRRGSSPAGIRASSRYRASQGFEDQSASIDIMTISARPSEPGSKHRAAVRTLGDYGRFTLGAVAQRIRDRAHYAARLNTGADRGTAFIAPKLRDSHDRSNDRVCRTSASLEGMRHRNWARSRCGSWNLTLTVAYPRLCDCRAAILVPTKIDLPRLGRTELLARTQGLARALLVAELQNPT